MCACVCVGVSLCGGQIEEKLVVVSSISMKLPKSVQQKEQIEPCNSFCKNTNLPKHLNKGSMRMIKKSIPY